MSRLTKFLVSAGILTAIAVAVGFLLSTGDGFDWDLTLVLVVIAIFRRGFAHLDQAGPRQTRSIVQILRQDQYAR